ncbi:uncharacterized protein TRAVEDRAFT_51856 [Trametes versicolor FP-101664 SS1]|uniref:uncharacterized protein n=1 Tax=Trametes versicolor (strain FP-101664) TaxID=717944 RepID=UPI0004623708|nr:uncharacterized protein TRAVEDRAFT_51856 [Trametes versicolor FP-101664 SS1]EIW54131.1 hypothetical protein TRAVEDRAFT_51856 [Trametes versicolor FP-101664 SS1]
MDAPCPTGHCPVRLSAAPDGQKIVSPLPRAGRNVRYYYIDFGLSSRFSKGSSSLVIGDVGQVYIPELFNEVLYDAFKVDIFARRDLYYKQFEKKYTSMEFLCPLIELMDEDACDSQRYPFTLAACTPV